MQTDAPRTVRAAGLVIALQGLAGLAAAVFLLVRALWGDSQLGAGNVAGQAGYFAVLAAGVLACGGGLLLGRYWARSPSIVVELLLLGIAWYVIGPSGQPLYGVPVALACVVVLVLLFLPSTGAWAQGEPPREASE